jgi:hypothetical protein
LGELQQEEQMPKPDYSLIDGEEEEAITAWAEHCQQTGQLYQQPSVVERDETSGEVVLSNMHGELWRYHSRR